MAIGPASASRAEGQEEPGDAHAHSEDPSHECPSLIEFMPARGLRRTNLDGGARLSHPRRTPGVVCAHRSTRP